MSAELGYYCCCSYSIQLLLLRLALPAATTSVTADTLHYTTIVCDLYNFSTTSCTVEHTTYAHDRHVPVSHLNQQLNSSLSSLYNGCATVAALLPGTGCNGRCSGNAPSMAANISLLSVIILPLIFATGMPPPGFIAKKLSGLSP
jgi:hypothetical protein